MVHIQNSTLAGGVAIGSAAALNIGPMGCILTGFAASAASVNAYKYVVPWVDSALGVKDTCGAFRRLDLLRIVLDALLPAWWLLLDWTVCRLLACAPL